MIATENGSVGATELEVARQAIAANDGKGFVPRCKRIATGKPAKKKRGGEVKDRARQRVRQFVGHPMLVDLFHCMMSRARAFRDNANHQEAKMIALAALTMTLQMRRGFVAGTTHPPVFTPDAQAEWLVSHGALTKGEARAIHGATDPGTASSAHAANALVGLAEVIFSRVTDEFGFEPPDDEPTNGQPNGSRFGKILRKVLPIGAKA